MDTTPLRDSGTLPSAPPSTIFRTSFMSNDVTLSMSNDDESFMADGGRATPPGFAHFGRDSPRRKKLKDGSTPLLSSAVARDLASEGGLSEHPCGEAPCGTLDPAHLASLSLLQATISGLRDELEATQRALVAEQERHGATLLARVTDLERIQELEGRIWDRPQRPTVTFPAPELVAVPAGIAAQPSSGPEAAQRTTRPAGVSFAPTLGQGLQPGEVPAVMAGACATESHAAAGQPAAPPRPEEVQASGLTPPALLPASAAKKARRVSFGFGVGVVAGAAAAAAGTAAAAAAAASSSGDAAALVRVPSEGLPEGHCDFDDLVIAGCDPSYGGHPSGHRRRSSLGSRRSSVRLSFGSDGSHTGSETRGSSGDDFSLSDCLLGDDEGASGSSASAPGDGQAFDHAGPRIRNAGPTELTELHEGGSEVGSEDSLASVDCFADTVILAAAAACGGVTGGDAGDDGGLKAEEGTEKEDPTDDPATPTDSPCGGWSLCEDSSVAVVGVEATGSPGQGPGPVPPAPCPFRSGQVVWALDSTAPHDSPTAFWPAKVERCPSAKGGGFVDVAFFGGFKPLPVPIGDVRAWAGHCDDWRCASAGAAEVLRASLAAPGQLPGRDAVRAKAVALARQEIAALAAAKNEVQQHGLQARCLAAAWKKKKQHAFKRTEQATLPHAAAAAKAAAPLVVKARTKALALSPTQSALAPTQLAGARSAGHAGPASAFAGAASPSEIQISETLSLVRQLSAIASMRPATSPAPPQRAAAPAQQPRASPPSIELAEALAATDLAAPAAVAAPAVPANTAAGPASAAAGPAQVGRRRSLRKPSRVCGVCFQPSPSLVQDFSAGGGLKCDSCRTATAAVATAAAAAAASAAAAVNATAPALGSLAPPLQWDQWAGTGGVPCPAERTARAAAAASAKTLAEALPLAPAAVGRAAVGGGERRSAMPSVLDLDDSGALSLSGLSDLSASHRSDSAAGHRSDVNGGGGKENGAASADGAVGAGKKAGAAAVADAARRALSSVNRMTTAEKRWEFLSPGL